MLQESEVAGRLRLVVGNIARMPVEAVVTAANSALMGGGGVDGAVHHAAGPELLEALREFDYCPEGEARITPGFRLQAKWVIHAVGPIYINGRSGEAQRLAAAYRAALHLAAEKNARTLAFPCISTGAYQFPRAEAADIALATVSAWIEASPLPDTVYFCVFDKEDAALYTERLGQDAATVEP